ncbi:hypothetical protein [Haliea sp. E17]|uniref:hypothetical protein n=1 Tax=Haliea sp. E17 TaxID=3401576 RepID=UPI003AAE3067
MDAVRQSAVLAVIAIFLSARAISAETSISGSAGFEYEYNDNIRITPENRISLSGWLANAGVSGRWATPRFSAESTLRLYSEHYDSADSKDLSPNFAEPDADDFDSDNQDFSASIAYDWERQRLSLYGQYRRDSTLNTQFLDTGLGGLAQIQGATREERIVLRPEWSWQLTERQRLQSTLQWQEVDYESELFQDYDYSLMNVAWSYLLNERLYLQMVPNYALYRNRALNSVESTTYGLQAGVIWAFSEKLRFNVLVGATEVSTKIDGGYYTFDIENFRIVFVEFEDQDSNGFTGNMSVDFQEEQYSLNFTMFSRYSPSADGGLREDSQASFVWNWEPVERLRLDVDTRYGLSKRASSAIAQEREYGEVGVRIGYQFAENWWVSGRYRYRTQQYKAASAGAGDSNLVSAGVSYRLPREIL